MRFLERFVFLSLLVTIPIQLGKFFWPDFAFVQGIRVDYIAPSIYLSDLFFILLFLFSFFRLRKKFVSFIFHPVTFVLFISLILSSFFANFPAASWYGVAKFLEFLYISFYIASVFKNKDISLFTFIFTLGGTVVSIILFFEFFSQHSLNGVFYFLGERNFSASTPGIAVFQEGGHLMLRPYATFPHPNVAGFYLMFCLVYLIFLGRFKNDLISVLKIGAATAIFIGICLTFSRSILLLTAATIAIRLYFGMRNSQQTKKIVAFFVAGFLCMLLGLIFFQRFEHSLIRDVLFRLDLLKISWQIFLSSPLFGVGLNNFYYHEVFFQKSITPILLQPVHNIYVLWIVQTGVLGGIAMVLFLKQTIITLFRKLNMITFNKSFYYATSLLLLWVLIIGLFDHYLLTLQQGQLLGAVLLGFSYSNVKRN